MKRETELELLDRLRGYLAAGTTVATDGVRQNPVKTYVDPALHSREIQRLFLEQPLVAGLSRDLDRAGSFKTLSILETDILLVRGRDGIARAFRNMCRDRGARLVSEERGLAARFTCPFHAWTYDADGRLVGVPHRECFGDVPDNSQRLDELPLVERHGILWVKITPGGFDIDALVGPLAEELADLHLGDLGDLAAIGTKTLDAAINWKLAIDTFGETYHFDSLHRNTVATYFHSNVHAYDVFGRNHRMVFAGKTFGSLVSAERSSWSYGTNTLTAYYLFPNTQLIVLPNHVDLFQVIPDRRDPQRSRTLYAYYPSGENEAGMEHAQAFELTALIIQHEDYKVAETAQASFATSPPEAVALFGRNEPARHHYHPTYSRALDLLEAERA